MDQTDEGEARAAGIVVPGASAGGIEALRSLSELLPADLRAAVFVVLHVAPQFDSRLPDILARVGPLPAKYAHNGDRIVGGRILAAPPDHHLLVRATHVELSRGPRENHARPSVDATLRSAARARRRRDRRRSIRHTGGWHHGADGSQGAWRRHRGSGSWRSTVRRHAGACAAIRRCRLRAGDSRHRRAHHPCRGPARNGGRRNGQRRRITACAHRG
ncbi:MAG: hypothetical protein IT532_11405 [Burkholderiales bacterium]|nr:hypothetical protein [Burkholderiales bacterium]